jgi:hypothetical protein
MLKKSKHKNVRNIQNRKKKRTENKKPKKTNRTTTLQCLFQNIKMFTFEAYHAAGARHSSAARVRITVAVQDHGWFPMVLSAWSG